MKNKALLLLSLLLIVSILITACGGSQPAATEAPQQQATEAPSSTGGNSGGSSGSGSTGGTLSIDSANTADEKVLSAAAYLYEGLVAVQQDGTVSGVLAESFQVSDDGLEYTFNLRSGVTFHDGTALNADAVISNFNRWFDPKDANRGSGAYEAWAANFGGFKGETTAEGKSKSEYDGIEKTDELTLLVHLNTPDADFLKKLSDPAFYIVSPAAFAGGDGGTGPYKFASGDDANVKLEPFAGYWNAAGIPNAGIDVPLK